MTVHGFKCIVFYIFLIVEEEIVLGTILLIIGIALIFGMLMIPLFVIFYIGFQEGKRRKRMKESRNSREKKW
jgi:Na+-transporting methylmalonyl-CoA/oxaloacetate decarboxylase gamma subunit